jgi:hypothetical protein
MANQTGPVDADRIRQRAFELWEQDGRPEGRDMDYWFRAEAELAGEGASGLETPVASGTSSQGAGARGRPSATDPGKAGASPSRGQGTADGGAKKAAAPKEAALAEERGEYVQQRRSRKKAEG